MCNAHIYLPGGGLWDLGYNGIVELGFKVTKDWGKIIVEFEHDDLMVLMKKLGELQNKCLEYKMIIHWDDAEGETVIQTKDWEKCNC